MLFFTCHDVCGCKITQFLEEECVFGYTQQTHPKPNPSGPHLGKNFGIGSGSTSKSHRDMFGFCKDFRVGSVWVRRLVGCGIDVVPVWDLFGPCVGFVLIFVSPFLGRRALNCIHIVYNGDL